MRTQNTPTLRCVFAAPASARLSRRSSLRSRVVGLLTLGCLVLSAGAAPSYPLTGVAVPPKNYTGGDASNSFGNWVPLDSTQVHKLRMVYGSDVASVTNKPVQMARDVAGRDPAKTPVIPYMGGYTTNLAPDANKAQTTYIKGVAMTRVGTLATAIPSSSSPNQETISFNVNVDLSSRVTYHALTFNPQVLIPRKDDPNLAGTYDIAYDKPWQYDSWLRVDGELMQITSVTYLSGDIGDKTAVAQVTAVRGYAGTTKTAHTANSSKVFSPTYLGDNFENEPRFDQGYPDNITPSTPKDGVNTIRYAVDPGTTDAADFRADIIDGFTAPKPAGGAYDGAWWDTFNQKFYNLCDARGNQIRPSEIWNFATGAPYTEDEFVQELRDFTILVRNSIAAPPAGHPAPYVLYANTGLHTYNLPTGTGTEILVDRPNATYDDGRLDGACFEDSFLTYPGPANESFRRVVDTDPVGNDDGKAWTNNLTRMIEAANSQRPFICMVGPAGELAGKLNPTEPDYFPKMKFAYASYLMAVNVPTGLAPKDITLSFGLPLLARRVTSGDEIYGLPTMCFAQIGNPVTSSNLTNVYPAGLKLAASGAAAHVYVRKFAAGFVAVYPWGGSGGTNVPVTLPSPGANKVWKDANNGTTVTSLTLSPGGAAVLVAQ